MEKGKRWDSIYESFVKKGWNGTEDRKTLNRLVSVRLTIKRVCGILQARKRNSDERC